MPLAARTSTHASAPAGQASKGHGSASVYGSRTFLWLQEQGAVCILLEGCLVHAAECSQDA